MGALRVIGLTGGIASGKSEVARMLRELGAKVVDADELARRVVEPGRPAYHAIIEEFGTEVVAPDGALDRKALGAVVFADASRRERLNALTHPHIAAEARQETQRYAAAGESLVFYEAALLVENRLHEALDGLIVVSVPAAVQVERVVLRDGLDPSAARARVDAQLPLADKVAAADYVIDNAGSRAETREQVQKLWHKLRRAPP